MSFRSRIIFQIPSPINNNPSITLRSIPPISSEERFGRRTVIIMPVTIIPPLTKSNIDIVFERTFLLTTKAIIDIATPTAPPKTISSTRSTIRSINDTPSKTIEIVALCITKDSRQ